MSGVTKTKQETSQRGKGTVLKNLHIATGFHVHGVSRVLALFTVCLVKLLVCIAKHERRCVWRPEAPRPLSLHPSPRVSYAGSNES